LLTKPKVVNYKTCIYVEQWRTQEFFSCGGGKSTNSVESRGQTERGSGGCSPLVRGSEGSCNLVEEISFPIVDFFFLIFGTLRLFMMTTNLFVIANVKQLRTGGSFSILLPFFLTSWGVGVLNSAIFNSFQIGLSLARFWRTFGISGAGC